MSIKTMWCCLNPDLNADLTYNTKQEALSDGCSEGWLVEVFVLEAEQMAEIERFNYIAGYQDALRGDDPAFDVDEDGNGS